MPWYKVPLAVYVRADAPGEARAQALGLLPETAGDENRLTATAAYPVELSQEQAHVHLRLREILLQADRDSTDGAMVGDPRFPGVKFSPQAAAELAALEFEEQQPELSLSVYRSLRRSPAGTKDPSLPVKISPGSPEPPALAPA